MMFDFEDKDISMEELSAEAELSAEPRPKPAFGELSNHPRAALDSCSAFFRDKESYLPICWRSWTTIILWYHRCKDKTIA